MKYQVPDSVLLQADKCSSNHSCIGTGRCAEHTPCRVVHATKKDTLFVEPAALEPCPYRSSFGELWICHCPVRHHLHAHYGF